MKEIVQDIRRAWNGLSEDSQEFIRAVTFILSAIISIVFFVHSTNIEKAHAAKPDPCRQYHEKAISRGQEEPTQYEIIGKGGQKVGAGGGVITIPAPIPTSVCEIDLKDTEQEPIIITAPRYKPEPEN